MSESTAKFVKRVEHAFRIGIVTFVLAYILLVAFDIVRSFDSVGLIPEDFFMAIPLPLLLGIFAAGIAHLRADSKLTG
jgi:hypothetical protein